ncbi:hypothetical protein BDV26DRAFT_184530 [Aspergillus bertholletiae]|uniref:CWH43-like N-terminal domain-containing protein n=1 Tax=Aspergillus bertholletiae TaxID=1226010 RepID=A0A5N7BAF0_9EURO|nr:hypothetical protein BDV26DRAFT_184530 [Aspergillus bertholletiae]
MTSINPLTRCHDSAWCFLHVLILNIPPSRLFLFPALTGSIWLLTLASLLLVWLVRGMPQYPGRSNPHFAFISDIASFEPKPLFLVGTSITAMGFVITVAAVHVVRYEPGFALVKYPVTDNIMTITTMIFLDTAVRIITTATIMAPIVKRKRATKLRKP